MLAGLAAGADYVTAAKPGYTFNPAVRVQLGSTPATASFETRSGVLFRDVLQAGWSAGASRARFNATVTSPVAEEGRSFSVIISGTNGYVHLGGGALSLSERRALRFFVHGGRNSGQQLYLEAFGRDPDSGADVLAGKFKLPAVQANTWREVVVPLEGLGFAPGTLAGLSGVRFSAPTAQKTIYVDNLQLSEE
jgi:hypothetical protein